MSRMMRQEPLVPAPFTIPIALFPQIARQFQDKVISKFFFNQAPNPEIRKCLIRFKSDRLAVKPFRQHAQNQDSSGKPKDAEAQVVSHNRPIKNRPRAARCGIRTHGAFRPTKVATLRLKPLGQPTEFGTPARTRTPNSRFKRPDFAR